MLLVFWVSTILIGVQWHLIALISIRTHDVEHLFPWLSSVSSLRFLFNFFPLFLNWTVCFLTEFLSSLHTLDESFIRYDFLWILSLFVSCHLILLTVSFADHTFLIFRKSSFLSLLWITPLVLYLKSHLCAQVPPDFVLCYLLEFHSFAFALTSVIHF